MNFKLLEGCEMKNKETVLVIGLGEIGRPIFEVLKESGKFKIYGFDLDETKMQALGQTSENLPKKVDVIHMCIPCNSQEKFVEAVVQYATKYGPRLLVVNSTIPPKTTTKIHEKCKCLVAHSPVYGTHRNIEYMKWEIRRWTKIVGGVNPEAAQATSKHFRKAGVKTTILSGPLETELTKLFETIYTAWMITFFQEMQRITRYFQADFEDIVRAIGEIHRTRLDRPIWYPGVIGGHCLIPNTELLLSVYDSEFLHLILKSNEKRKMEIKDQRVSEEVEKVRKRAEALQKELMNKLEER